MKKIKIIIAIVAIIVTVFLLGKVSYNQIENKTGNVDTVQTFAPEVRSNDWVLGTTTAKVTIIEYLDFECEACGAFYPLITELKKEYKDDLRLVVRYFPLPGHKNSRTAAHAAEAAGKQGKFWEMYGILFTKQSEWGEQQAANQDQFEKYAIEAGVVDIEQWKNDVVSDEVKNRVEDSYREATRLNLQGTPSFFLNGKRIENPKGYESFKSLIDNELKN